MTSLRSAVLFALVLSAIIVSRSILIVQQYEVAVVQDASGAPQVLAPGLHWKSPVGGARYCDMRVDARTVPGQDLKTGDQHGISVTFVYDWRIADAAKSLSSVQCDHNLEELKLQALLEPVLAQSVAKLPLTDVVTAERGGISDDSWQAVQRQAQEQWGVRLLGFHVQSLELTLQDSNVIYKKMADSLDQQAAQMKQEGLDKAAQIRADYAQKRQQLLSDGMRDAQQVRGQADAKAAAIYAQAYARNPQLAAIYRSLQAYQTALSHEGDVLVITPEGEFFKYLHESQVQSK